MALLTHIVFSQLDGLDEKRPRQEVWGGGGAVRKRVFEWI